MKKQDIHLGDWTRIIFGEHNPGFFVELVIRTVLLYLVLIIAMRLTGSRMAAQLSRNEKLGVVSLAAAIGIPLQVPDKGLLPAFLIAIMVVYLGRLLASVTFNMHNVEAYFKGDYNILVTDGVMNL